jgi:hemoglobin-like flavoprotein
MPIDFNKFKKKEESLHETHPIKIYDGLTRSGGLNDLWRGQYLALEKWQELRNKPNLVVGLNTGGGKTVIGLLQGQALVNETQGRVFYLCGSIQLIKQTADAAKSLGLKVATYYNRKFENEREFNMGKVLCITTYQALFNGFSRFAKDEISGLIFDDSHVASHIIRDHYTLHLSEDDFPETYSTLINTVKKYFEDIHSSQLFEQVVNHKNDPTVLFIPMFVWEEAYKKITQVMVEEGVPTGSSTKYAWEYLRDHLDLCSVFLTSYSIEITPFLPPVHLSKFMGENTKKIFLSATVQDNIDSIRSFGFLPGERIAPKTRAGESERLIVTPYVNKELSEKLFEHVIDYSKTNKVLVISSSERRARRWRQHELTFSSEDFAQRVYEFKSANSGLLVAPARFEGMDFPNDTCRTLVIDGLPSGTGHLEKLMWNSLGEVKSLQGTIASRVVQSLGRISRGNDDYGIVYLFGNDLADWITRKPNRDRLPRYICAQLELGERMSESLTSIEELEELEKSVLERNPGWSELHQEEVKNASVTSEQDSSESETEKEEKVQLPIAETHFIKHLWNRDYVKAARKLEQHLDLLFKDDKGLAAWHSHWIGYCYLKAGDEVTANIYLKRAAKSFRVLGVIPEERERVVASPLIPDNESQSARILKVLSERGEINYGSFSQMDDRLSALSQAKIVSSNVYEESIKWLGRYLGFQSTRPDQESGIGRGPDNFWLSSEVGIMIESKSDKGGVAPYSKKEVGQTHNHLEWIKEEYPDIHVNWKLMIAGPDVEAAHAASPSKEMNVWLPEEVHSISERIRQLIRDTWKESTPATIYSELEKNLKEAELTHMDILNSLPERPIRKSSHLRKTVNKSE